ncbi:MAG: hypothetical protein AB7S74_06255 [Hyphomicrobium sp.]
MSKGVQLWPGDRMRAFYRRHITAESSLDPKTTERLVEALTKATNRMLVWEMPAEPAAAKVEGGKAAKASAKTSAQTNAKSGKSPESAPNDPPFDPYAFSAMVILAKQGSDALAARLAGIKSVDHLKKLADAQHLGFDRSLTKIDDVRKALLKAAEQRLADRRAAAS